MQNWKNESNGLEESITCINPKGIGRDAEHGKEPAIKHVGLEGSCAGIP